MLYEYTKNFNLNLLIKNLRILKKFRITLELKLDYKCDRYSNKRVRVIKDLCIDKNTKLRNDEKIGKNYDLSLWKTYTRFIDLDLSGLSIEDRNFHSIH